MEDDSMNAELERCYKETYGESIRLRPALGGRVELVGYDCSFTESVLQGHDAVSALCVAVLSMRDRWQRSYYDQ